MSPMAISWIVFACVFGGALFGMALRSRLPEAHLSPDSKDVIKLAMGLLGTMSALVLALLIASAKTSHDTQTAEITQMAADFILLDRVLAHYGPETAQARGLLQHALNRGIDDIWPQHGNRHTNWESQTTTASANIFFDKIQQLQPHNDFQRSLRAQAIQITAELGRIRSLLLEQTQGTIPMPFLVVLSFWLAVIFTGFGLLAPRNATVAGVLFLSSVSIAGAIFLILELDRPFEGLIQISSAPLLNAAAHLGK